MSNESPYRAEGEQSPAAPQSAAAKLEAKRRAREEANEGRAEAAAEKRLHVEELLEQHVEKHGRMTIPDLGDEDKRDPFTVYADKLAEHPIAEVERAFAELARVAPKMKAAIVPTGAGLFVVRPPLDGAYKRFRNAFWKDNQKAEATEVLALACTVYPSAGEAMQAFKSTPVCVEAIANRAIDLGGAKTDPK